MKRRLREAGRKNPRGKRDADSSPKMVTQSLRCARSDNLAQHSERQWVCSRRRSLPPAPLLPASC